MKKLWLIVITTAAVGLPLAPAQDAPAQNAPAPAVRDEAQLIQILQASRPSQETRGACADLRRIATDRSIPALAALLRDPRTSHSARYVLEAMKSRAAGQALIDALESTSGAERLGIVGSLGARREPQAIPALTRLLTAAADAGANAAADNADRTALGAAAAAALGHIEGDGAVTALEQAWGKSTGVIHGAAADGLLRQAHRRLAAGDHGSARRLFNQVYEHETDARLRMAAWQGVVRSAGDEGLRLLIDALSGSSPEAQTAAMRLVPDLPLAGAGREFTRLLPTLPPKRQVALLNAWIQRPELPSVQTVAPLLDSTSDEVKISAIRALGRIGDGSMVRRLVQTAATRGPAQDAARLTLTEMPGRDVTSQLLSLLRDPAADTQLEVVRALADRGDKEAVAPLLGLARSEATPIRQAALRALVVLIDERQLDELVKLVVQAPSDSTRAEAARAVALTYERISPRMATPSVQPLLEQLARGTPATRIALLPACRTLALPEIRTAMRAAIADSDTHVRTAAALAASRTTDPELLPDLKTLACNSAEDELRDVGVRGCVRLIAAAGDRISNASRVEVFRAIASAARTPAQKRALLAGLSEGRTLAELEMAAALAADDAVRNEAIPAVAQIAPRVGESAPTLAVLQRLGGSVTAPALTRQIETARRNVEARAGYLTSWHGAAFTRVVDRTSPELMATAFAPELKPDDLRGATTRARLGNWEPMAAGVNARRPMLLRGGGPTVFSVTYAYTWLRAPQAMTARLEIEHDAPIKSWLNGDVVLSGPAKEADSASVKLNAGWNLLLVKIAQPGRGWGFAVRLKNADGSALPEVVADASAEPSP